MNILTIANLLLNSAEIINKAAHPTIGHDQVDKFITTLKSVADGIKSPPEANVEKPEDK